MKSIRSAQLPGYDYYRRTVHYRLGPPRLVAAPTWAGSARFSGMRGLPHAAHRVPRFYESRGWNVVALRLKAKEAAPEPMLGPHLFGGRSSAKNVVGRSLRLSGGGYYHPFVATELGQPALNIRGLVLEDGRRDSRFGAQISG
jgi:hypothetical protein